MHIHLPSSLSVSRFSLLSRSLSVLCVESDRLCVPVVLLVLGSGFRSYSSSLKRDVSPLLNSSEMLRAVSYKEMTSVMGFEQVFSHDFLGIYRMFPFQALIVRQMEVLTRTCFWSHLTKNGRKFTVQVSRYHSMEY